MITTQIQSLFEQADGVVILAGAGMGVDAGIPDFRGKNGIWTEDKSVFMRFSKASSFQEHPVDAWNFYISRFLKYSTVEPHKGYYDLLNIDKDMFVVTSNIDMHFAKAGFDTERIFEVHGDLRTVQCSKFCCRKTWSMPVWDKEITDISEIPKCTECGAIVRPQVMLFNDPFFYFNKVNEQHLKYRQWELNKKNIIGIEIGAGLAVPTIRQFGHENTKTLVRINPFDKEINRPQDICIPETAIAGIDLLMKLIYDTRE